MATFLLIHSPLVGPLTWQPVAAELRARGHAAIVPELRDRPDSPEPPWGQHVARASGAVAATAFSGGEPLVVVGHSGAGYLLPAISVAVGRPPAGYVFVDAQLPVDAAHPLQPLPTEILDIFAHGGRYPNWTDEQLRDILPDDALRAALLADIQPRELDYFETAVPVPSGWPDAPRAYLLFSPAYAEQYEQARTAGYMVRQLPGGHFHMLVDPVAVAEALVALSAPWVSAD